MTGRVCTRNSECRAQDHRIGVWEINVVIQETGVPMDELKFATVDQDWLEENGELPTRMSDIPVNACLRRHVSTSMSHSIEFR